MHVKEKLPETAAVTEAEREKAEEKSEKKSKVLFARRSGKTIRRSGLMARGALLTAFGIVLLMAILFAASALLNFEGSFTIRAVRPTLDDKVIAISETYGFTNPTVELSARAIEGMDNITYNWLPLEELDKHDGCYNGENYIAYTYYIQNSGKEPLNYEADLLIIKRTLGIEKAVRVMVYCNGEPTIYAAATDDGGTEIVPDGIVNFESSDTVFRHTRENMAVGDIDRYTVVAWLEGEDPECVNDVCGGVMKMEMQLSILDEEAEDPGETESGENETNVTEVRAE